MSSLAGKYIFDKGENVEDYLIHLGVGVVVRKVYSVTHPELEITYDEVKQVWTITIETVFHKYELKFRLDEMVDSDETFDIRKCKTIVTKCKDQEDAFLMIQTPKDSCSNTAEVRTKISKSTNGAIVFEMECGGKTAKQIFKQKVTASGDAASLENNNNLPEKAPAAAANGDDLGAALQE